MPITSQSCGEVPARSVHSDTAMGLSAPRRRGTVVALVLLGVMGFAQAHAQQPAQPPQSMPPQSMPPQAMPVQPAPIQGQGSGGNEARGPRPDRNWDYRGPGMMGGAMPLMMFCNEHSELSPRFLKRFERAVQIKPEQKADFEALKAAVGKSDQIFKAACPTAAEIGDHTPVNHLARIEKTAQATVEAMKLVRPPFDALYAKLDDKQRDRLRWMPHEGGGSPLGWMQRMREGVHHLFDQDR